MRNLSILTLAIVSLAFYAFADEATQTDWSGGDGVPGPVTDWGDEFDTSTDINWSVLPGVFRLSSTPTTPVEHTVDASFDAVVSVYAADVDGDDDMDVLGAALYADDITWWENDDGTGTSWTEHTVDGNFDNAVSVYAADVDGDDDIDVLGAAYLADDITWWENDDGTGTSWTEHTVDGSFDSANSVYAADIDGDDDMDVLGASPVTDDITWWENMNGIGTSWTEHTVDGSFDRAVSVYAADIDGDDDMDVLGAAEDARDITWWENDDGTGTSWTEHIVDGNFWGAYSVYAADMDGDDDMDVLGAAYLADDITWWENDDGTGTSWTEHTVDGSFDSARSVYAADVDGDGDMDVLGAAYIADDITWWENTDGSGTSWTEHTVDGSFGGAISVCAADVDGDDDMDVLGAARNDDDITWWEVTEFNSAGDLTSSIYDTEVDTGTMDLEWGPISWTDDVPTDTTVTVEVRASNDSGAMGSWTAVTSSGDDLSNYVDDDTRYFQYRTSLATTDTDASPTFEDIDISWNPLGIDGDEGNLPRTFALHPAVPNPNDGSAIISFALPRACDVDLSLYDIKGRKIATIAEGSHQPGEYSATVSGLSSGVYVYRMNADEFSDTKKMVVK